MINVKEFIAERNLYYSVKGKYELKRFSIKISRAYKDVTKLEGSICFVCHVVFEGLDEESIVKYGMDSIQVLNIATNLEPALKRLSKKYNIFWEDKSPYF